MFLFQNLVTDGLEIAFSITVWGTSAGGLSLFSSSLLPPLWEMGRKRIKRKVMVWSDSYREALIRSMVEQLVFVGLPRRICHSLLPVLLCASVFLFCTYCKDKFLHFPFSLFVFMFLWIFLAEKKYQAMCTSVSLNMHQHAVDTHLCVHVCAFVGVGPMWHSCCNTKTTDKLTKQHSH